MQQFLLFCTMLIITSEAFAKELHGSKIFKSTVQRSRLVPKLKFQYPDIFANLKFPMFSVPTVRNRPDYIAPFFVPMRLQHFEHKNYFRPKKRRFNTKNNFRRNIFKQRKRNSKFLPIKPNSFILNSPQCFSTMWLSNPGFHFGSEHDLFNFFGEVQNALTGNPTQFIVCLYPIFNNLDERTFNYLTKRRFSALKKQYLTDMKHRINKKKRSVTKTMSSVDNIEPQKDENEVDESEKQFKNIKENFNNSMPQPDDFSPKSSDRLGEEILPEEGDSVLNVNHDSNEESQGTDQSFLPFVPRSTNYLTQSPLLSPKVALEEGPNDVNLHKPTLTNEENNLPDLSANTSEIEKENFKDESKNITSLNRLKKVLREVESLLRGGEEDDVNVYGVKEAVEGDPGHPAKSSEKETKKETNVKLAESTTLPANAASIKYKIDKEALPLLEELSIELGKISSFLETKSLAGARRCSKKKRKKPKELKAGFERISKKVKPKVRKVKCKKLKCGKKKVKKIKAAKEGKNVKKEGVKECPAKQPSDECNPDGTWISTELGFELTFSTKPNMMLKVDINSKPDSKINTKWSIYGLTLSKQGGPLMLGAVYPQKRKLASFIGQCKICKDQDVILGVWTIYTCGKSFTDIWRGVETKLDVLKKVVKTP